jgi:hypothetical protein
MRRPDQEEPCRQRAEHCDGREGLNAQMAEYTNEVPLPEPAKPAIWCARHGRRSGGESPLGTLTEGTQHGSDKGGLARGRLVEV